MIKVADVQPWAAARFLRSPHFNDRSSGHIHGVVLHHTAGSDDGAESWMANPASKVSCHLHFRRDGSTTRMVIDNRRAWHTGNSVWRSIQDVNSITLGWEIGNWGNGVEPYTDAQYAALAQVAVHYIRQGLKLEDFVSHETVARPFGRKNDPLGFDWRRFRGETDARLHNETIRPEPPKVVWSDFFQDYLLVTHYVDDTEWYFVVLSEVGKPRRAEVPLSRMPS